MSSIPGSGKLQKLPWTEEPGGLQSVELQSVGHDSEGDTHIHTHAEFCLVFKLTNLTSIGVSLA